MHGLVTATGTGRRAQAVLAARLALHGTFMLALMLVSGCEEALGTLQIPPLTPPWDGAVRDSGPPDGAVLCDVPEDCDDGIACTRDVCVAGGYCVNARDSSRCDDGVFCNGREICDGVQGCRPSQPPSCDDGNVCTLDSCNEAEKRCAHDPRDLDGDGEADWHCAGGTDCDDLDPTRGSEALEICDDGIDNDCDGLVDESDCGSPAHDRCDDALPIRSSGAIEVSLRGARHDYVLSCGATDGREVAFELLLDEAQDVTLRARGLRANGDSEQSTLALRSDCDDLSSELECRLGFPGVLRRRALPAGRYFILAHSGLASRLVLEVRLDPPTTAPDHESCETARPLAPLGERLEESLVDVSDATSLACGIAGAADLFYRLDLLETSDVEVAVSSATGERMAVSVRGACEDADSSLRCLSDAPALGRLRSVPPGEYFIVVEGPESREVDFSLDVAVLPPTDVPAGDDCERAIDLELDEEVDGTLAGREDLVDVACGCESCSLYLRDAVYRLQLQERMDVRITVEGGAARMRYALRSSCEDAATQLACGDGRPASTRVRDLPEGTHYLIVEGPPSSPFTLRAEPLPRTIAVEVTGNSVCALATTIAPAGGVFIGDTTGAGDDYGASCGGGAFSPDAAFVLELNAPSRVRALLEAEYDAVLYRIVDLGDGAQACALYPDSACDDDSGGGTNSLLDEELEAGVHYYIVDGYGFGNQGPYVFEVSVEAL